MSFSGEKCAVLALVVASTGCMKRGYNAGAGTREEWDAATCNPRAFDLDGSFVLKYDCLPKLGRTANVPWAETYWPDMSGGIANRWFNPAEAGLETDAWSYHLYTREELLSWSPEKRKVVLPALSPAEKYDLYRGRYDYPTVKKERGRACPTDAGWEGICHGWSPASLNYAEPNAVTLANPDGIEVPFAASDVKGLLSYMEAWHGNPALFVGLRCNEEAEGDPNTRSLACRDVNPGAFHVVLANLIGIQKRGFVADMVPDTQVWNHPVMSFESRELQVHEGAAPGLKKPSSKTRRTLEVETTLRYRVEAGPQWNPGGPAGNMSTAVVQYYLELDGDGNIVGGEWMSDGHGRPDFLWIQPKREFTGDFAALGEIYKAALQSSPQQGTGGACVPPPAAVEALGKHGSLMSMWHGSGRDSFFASLQVDMQSPRRAGGGGAYAHKFFVKHSETDKSNMAFTKSTDGSVLEGIRYNLSWDANKTVPFKVTWSCESSSWNGEFDYGSKKETLQIFPYTR